MKISNGFVSNSSSCSFLIVGWYCYDSNLIDKYDELGLTYYGDNDIIGFSLPDADDYSIEDVPVSDILKLVEKASDVQKELDLPEEAKIIYGMRAC